MPTYRTDAEGELSIERVAPRKTEEELREDRSQRFVALLEKANVGAKPEVFDTQGVRMALGKSEESLERDAAATFAEGFRRMMARESADQ